jgi:anti-anti-sigma factor
VRLRGEHDCSTDDALCLELACAIALNDGPLVVDLSEVSFMSASTLGVIVRAREFLRGRSRSLTLRCPSAFARHVIEACGLGELVGPSAGGPGDLSAQALRSWVEVPPAERSDGRGRPPTPAPAPAQLARARALRAHPASTKGMAGAP